MEKIAIISDIHGNFSGLQTVMTDIENCGCNRIICLGDLVDGGDYNDEVVRFLRDNQIACVRGNHDEFNNLELAKDVQEFIDSLPNEIVELDRIYTHISPRIKKNTISSPVEAWNVFCEISYRIVFVGHVHVPLIFGEKCEEFGSSTVYEFNYGEPFHLDLKDRYVISVGAVGYGRDQIKKLRYVIYNQTENSVEFRAVDGELLPLGFWAFF
ncbi:metallophosphoesterase [Aerosakkonemataceae cyanobacterium BLCC-F154]|uniref:Metallophosphoesterase n=1 Tax=Floridaenema fluviatile BLCC-F154 TaxID=3153640 RepID=A0ABV4YHD8_9CYAN